MIPYYDELFLRGLAAYFGLTIKELANLIKNDDKKLKRFYNDFKYNHN